MKKNATITALALALVVAMSAWAVAGPGYGRGCGGNGNGRGYYSQLTPEKQAEVEAVVGKYSPKLEDLRTQMWTKHSVLQAMINKGDVNEKKIGELTAEMTSLRDQMRDTRDAMNKEIVAKTGIEMAYGRGPCGQGGQGGQGFGKGYGRGNCPGPGPGSGQGRCY